MKIYVASLADYNNGIIFGKWFDIDHYDFAFELEDAIKAMLRKSHAFLETGHTEREAIEVKVNPVDYVEYAIYDTEDCPSHLRGEYTSVISFFEWKAATKDMDAERAEAFEEWMDYGHDMDVDGFEDDYCGKFCSEEDFAAYMIESSGVLDRMPRELQYYFDYRAYGRDLFCGDYYMTESGNVFRQA